MRYTRIPSPMDHGNKTMQHLEWAPTNQPRFDASPSTAHHHGDFHHSVLQSPMASRLEGLGQDVPKCVGSVMLYVHVADLLI